MKKNGVEWKVGLFVAIGLGLLGLLIIKFSKGSPLFVATYKLYVKTQNVGGIIPGAVVLMAGVPIGNVRNIELEEDGKTVSIEVEILKKYRIRAGSVFTIRQAGFLGDRFIGVTPGPSDADLLRDGQVVYADEPFDLQEVARSATGLMKKLEQTAQHLNNVVARLDQTLLAGETLTNLTVTVANFRRVSEKSLGTLDSINTFVDTNLPPLQLAVTNFSLFSAELNRVAFELRETITTNRNEFTASMKNIEASTGKLNELLGQLSQGQGLAGALLKDEALAQEVSMVISNFSVFSSNLNRRGLWGVIRKPKPAEEKR